MDDLPFPLKLADVCLHLSYSDEEMSGDISIALSQAHKELTAQHNAIKALQARVAELEALIELNRSEAFAATNPANWQRNNTLQARHDHFADTLDKISKRGEDITILEETFSSGYECGKANSRADLKELAAKRAMK